MSLLGIPCLLASKKVAVEEEKKSFGLNSKISLTKVESEKKKIKLFIQAK